LAIQLAVRLHKITIEKLPKFEMFEEGSQVRRSSKSIVSNIVEGFGRRRYKNEFFQFLTYAVASCDETKTLTNALKQGLLVKMNLREYLMITKN
jgi:four helix bundle protein